MQSDDTIIAVSSAPGRSARAIIRLSGPAIAAIIDTRLRGVGPPGAHRAVLLLGMARELPVLALRFAAPRSYTGEDTLELLLPGSPALIETALRLLSACEGVRPATPGEFSARAYLNGRLSLDEAEGIAQSISAATDAELRAAMHLTSGRSGAQYRGWSDGIAALLALVEAGIDFTDQEDVVAIGSGELAARIEAVVGEIESALGSRRGRESPSALPFVALVGKPNAGKSTLFNALLGRRRAVTSPSAGTTRDVLTEALDLSVDAPGGGTVLLADLAGLESITTAPGDSPAPPAGDTAQSQALDAIARADIVLNCDASGRFGPLPPTTARVIQVRTKADLRSIPADPEVISICALDGRNLPALRRRIAETLRGALLGDAAVLLPRHRAALQTAADQLNESIELLPRTSAAPPAPEITADHLRRALDALGDLTGRIEPDQIIGRIFASFCVGK